MPKKLVRKNPLEHHHGEAESLLAAEYADEEVRQGATLRSIAHSLQALVWVQAAEFRELRKFRLFFEELHNNETVSFNATVTLVPKDGGNPMSVPVARPTDTDDVQCAIDPKNRAGDATTGPFTWTENNGQLTLQPAADGKSCLAVTSPGALDAIVTCTDTASGNTETFPISRVAAPPPDNLTVTFNGTSTVVPKAAPPPTP